MKTAIKILTALSVPFLALAGYFVSLTNHKPASFVFLVIGLACWAIAFGLYLRTRQLKNQISLHVTPKLTDSKKQITHPPPHVEHSVKRPSLDSHQAKGEQAMPKKTKQNTSSSVSNSITDSPIINSPGSIQAPGGNVTINQGTWVMSRQEQIAITKTLQAHAPATIHMLMVGDSDARKYAAQIMYAIKDANWNFEPVNYAFMLVGVYGVHIRMSDPDLRDAVVRAFNTAGIPIIVDDKTDHNYPNAILVGVKP